MCGLIGLVSLTNKTAGFLKRKAWFEQALFVDTLRGVHSTGMGLVTFSKMEDPVTIKRAQPAYIFLHEKAVEQAMFTFEHNCVVMGHNRKATQGKVSDENAHPFKCGDVLMAHNGTVNQAMSGLDTTFSVDSEALCDALSKKPAVEVLEALRGAFALQWYNSKDHSYYLARNKERPLHFAFHEKGLYMLVASESWMIRGLAARNEIALDDDKVYSLKPGYILGFPLSKMEDLREYDVVPFTPAAALSTTTTTTQWTGWAAKFSEDKNYGKELFGKNRGKMVEGSKQHKKHLENLQTLGFSFGERVRVYDLQYTPYKKTDNPAGATGCLEGYVDLPKTFKKSSIVETISHRVPFHKSFNFLSTAVWGSIVGCTIRESGKSRYYLLIVDNLTRDKSGNIPIKESPTDNSFVRGPGGVYISRKEFLRLTTGGCVLCDAVLTPSDAEGIEWFEDESPCCPGCSAELAKWGAVGNNSSTH